MTDRTRNKHLATLLADAPHPTRFRTSNGFHSARVRWLLDLADAITDLGLADADELAAAARSSAFGLVREAINTTANPGVPAAV